MFNYDSVHALVDYGVITYIQNIISVSVAKIPTSDFRAHVPSVERASCELDSTAVEHHAGHCGKAIPLETQINEPIESVRKNDTK